LQYVHCIAHAVSRGLLQNDRLTPLPDRFLLLGDWMLQLPMLCQHRMHLYGYGVRITCDAGAFLSIDELCKDQLHLQRRAGRLTRALPSCPMLPLSGGKDTLDVGYAFFIAALLFAILSCWELSCLQY
jgi:hypothetical protein